MKLTICTPTYNRGKLLKRLYESLISQSCKEFEWIIIDDGSTDDTGQIVKMMSEELLIDIVYYKQENQGKHVAINKAVDIAKGNLFFIVDSDDWLPVDSVEKILFIEKNIQNKEIYAGVAGNKISSNGKIIGTTFEGDSIDCTSLQRKKHNINGDKAEIFYTDILKKYPFPVFENEKFLTESVVWYRIAKDGYVIHWTNEPLYYCEYLEGGLSSTKGKITNNFNGYMLTVSEEFHYQELGLMEKLKGVAVCGAIALEKKMSLTKVADKTGIPLLYLLSIGILAYVYKELIWNWKGRSS